MALSAARNAYYGFAIPEYAANAAYKAGVESKLPKAVGTTNQAKNKPEGKLTNEYTGKKTKTLKREFQILESYAKEAGVNIRVVDGIEDAEGKQSEAHEGYYNPKTNEIVLSVKTGEDKLLYVAGHELIHRTRAYSEEAYEALRNIVLEHLKNAENYDLETRISEIQAVYKAQGAEINRDGAIEEIVAKSYAQALSDRAAVAKIAARDMQLFEKIRSILNEICDTFDRIAKRIAASDPEAREFMGEVDTLKEMRDTFFGILDNMEGGNENKSGKGKKYAARL